ncbi:MAG: hypothetical protein WCI62_02080, partial [Erysipelotrichaceae bacterium]
ILNEKTFLVGYDEEEIGAFIPRELRQIAKDSCDLSCSSYKTCGKIREEDVPHKDQVKAE